MAETAILRQALPNLERKSRKNLEFCANTSCVNGVWVSLKGTRAYPWIIPGSSLLWCSSGGYRFQFQSIRVLTPAARALRLWSITSPAIRSPLQIDRAKCSNSVENRSHKMGPSLSFFSLFFYHVRLHWAHCVGKEDRAKNENSVSVL